MALAPSPKHDIFKIYIFLKVSILNQIRNIAIKKSRFSTELITYALRQAEAESKCESYIKSLLYFHFMLASASLRFLANSINK